ncbi:MAG: gliding motility-associated C-terminal domain-containing protein [Fimbriimonadaceae bacterium]|nr:gliding motility-associated C-terminal domain-containing protein [Chitinophagales bacterium]
MSSLITLIHILLFSNVSAQTVHENATIIEEKILVPNAFSPNNDGVNDEFKIFIRENIYLESFIIMNKFGEIVFETKDVHAKWNGKYKNISVPENSYMYMISFIVAGEEGIQSKKGYITLFR